MELELLVQEPILLELTTAPPIYINPVDELPIVPIPGPEGPQGPQGEVGPEGEAGNTILYDVGEPDISKGRVGDFYINTQSIFLYGPKRPISGWPDGISLVGPQGADGQSVDLTGIENRLDIIELNYIEQQNTDW